MKNIMKAVRMDFESCHFAIGFYCYCRVVRVFSVGYLLIDWNFFYGLECGQFCGLSMCAWKECVYSTCRICLLAQYCLFCCSNLLLPYFFCISFWERCVNVSHGGCLINFFFQFYLFFLYILRLCSCIDAGSGWLYLSGEFFFRH